MIYFEQDKIFAVKKIGENGDHYDKNRVGGIPGSSPVWQYLSSGRTAFITQPAMSRRMKSMEEELGYSLLSVDAVREVWNLQRMEKNSFRSRNAC